MFALLMFTSLATGQLFLSPTEGARDPNAGSGGPASERRLFDVRSHQAWEIVQKRLRELGLATDKIDRGSQLALTKWRDIGATGLEWLPAPALPEQYAARRVRFQVFVSPFAEPAHVYVGSLAEVRHVPSGASATAYNVANVNTALMAEIAKAIGQDGRPIPVDREQRRQLALSALKDDADDCLRHGPPPRGAKLTPPRKIRLSEFEFIYPAPALAAGKEGAVQVEFTILEDGGVTDIRLLGPRLGDQFAASAMGAASLLLYSPAKLNECRVTTTMTYRVRYRTRRAPSEPGL